MLQELIKKIEAKITAIEKSKWNHTKVGKIAAYREAIKLLTDALPQFEECIKKAVTYGNRQEYYDGTETLAQDYYNQNYKP